MGIEILINEEVDEFHQLLFLFFGKRLNQGIEFDGVSVESQVSFFLCWRFTCSSWCMKDELIKGYVEEIRISDENGKARLDSSSLVVGDGVLLQMELLGKLLLGEPVLDSMGF